MSRKFLGLMAMGAIALMLSAGARTTQAFGDNDCDDDDFGSCYSACYTAPSCCAPAPVCCEPAPVCCAPAPVCCAPAPVCCAPAPVCCAPAPSCCAPVASCCAPAPAFHGGPIGPGVHGGHGVPVDQAYPPPANGVAPAPPESLPPQEVAPPSDAQPKA